MHHSKVATDIRRYGWHCLHVFPTQDEEGGSFTYSIGFTESYGAPEIAIFGASREKAHALLSECASLLRNGHTIQFGVEDANVLAGGYTVVFKPVRSVCMGEYFGTAMRHYGGKAFIVAVMFLPDRQHRFPWQVDYNYMPADEALAIV